MLPFELPAPDPQANPAFRDAAGAQVWVSQLQLTNITHAHEALASELDKLNRTALPAKDRLGALEALRDTLAYVQLEYARRLAGKPVPLSERSTAVLKAVADLWHATAVGYGHCLSAAIEGEASVEGDKALICQRGLSSGAHEILEWVRLAYEFDPELWRIVNRFYALADELEVARVPVADGADTHTCADLYVKVLLTGHANPYELSRRQLNLVDRWLDHWDNLVTLSLAAPRSGEGAPPLEVNLSTAAGLRSPATEGFSTAVRYLDMSDLSKEMRVKSVLLLQGHAPDTLGFGADCSAQECIELLGLLHRNWCEGPAARLVERTPSQETAQVCYGIPAVNFYVTGKPFRQPRHGGEVSPQEAREIAALGHRASDTSRLKREQLTGLVIETWHIEDRSILGLRLIIREQPGEPIAPNRLIGTLPSDRKTFALGVVRWAMVTREGQLRAGVRTLPGDPEGAAVRPTGINVAATAKYVQAILLPAIPAVQIPASLILPSGWFQPKRVIELSAGGALQKVMLEYLIERGTDFERVSFKTA
jgi:cyclic-di-GMP-binding protein